MHQQDAGKVAADLAFLRKESDRLGITFEVLGDQYGKFAVAATEGNFTLDATRRIFTVVAEAARVNKLSKSDLSGARVGEHGTTG